MRALVIGAGGFVGGYLVRHLLQAGDEVIGTTMLAAEPIESIRMLPLDITDRTAVERVIGEVAPDVIYHLAGISFVPEAERDFQKTLTVNVGGTQHVVSSARGVGGLLFVSSAEVYGHITSADLPIHEGTELRPANNYSLSKRMAELVVERYQRQGLLRCAIARPFNHIGPGQDSRFVASNFALQLARVARGLASPLLSVGNLEARRDFSDVRDIVRGYRLIATKHQGIFNLGSGTSRSIQELLDTLIDISGISVEATQDPSRMRGPEVPELFGSNERVTRTCGWVPEIPFQQSLEDLYRYWYDRVDTMR